MAALELIGYTQKETKDLISQISLLLDNLEFAKDVVWITHDAFVTVVDFKGVKKPFLRIYTRSQDRANVLITHINFLCSIEVIYIGISVLKEKVLIFK